MPKLMVFLGNPGKEYRNTRHNAGFMLCETCHGQDSWQNKFHGLYSRQGDCIYLLPQTFMNCSGVSVSEASHFFGIDVPNIIVVHDDLELSFGDVRLRQGGGMGGHNGLRSIKQNLGSDEFFRLRIGIGRPQTQQDVASYVLSRFSPDEEAKLPAILNNAYTMLDSWSKT